MPPRTDARETLFGLGKLTEVEIEERRSEIVGKLAARSDLLIDQEGIKQASDTKNRPSIVERISLKFEIDGVTIEIGTKESTPEIDD